MEWMRQMKQLSGQMNSGELGKEEGPQGFGANSMGLEDVLQPMLFAKTIG
jgi:hypothetical protein